MSQHRVFSIYFSCNKLERTADYLLVSFLDYIVWSIWKEKQTISFFFQDILHRLLQRWNTMWIYACRNISLIGIRILVFHHWYLKENNQLVTHNYTDREILCRRSIVRTKKRIDGRLNEQRCLQYCRRNEQWCDRYRIACIDARFFWHHARMISKLVYHKIFGKLDWIFQNLHGSLLALFFVEHRCPWVSLKISFKQ